MEIVFRPFNERSNDNTHASSIAEYGVVTISNKFTLGTGITQYAPTRISIYQITNMDTQTKNEIIAERERERERERELKKDTTPIFRRQSDIRSYQTNHKLKVQNL